jgi:SAM-dependent methyltransferase
MVAARRHALSAEDGCLLPQGVVRALEGTLHAARLLNVRPSHAKTSGPLLQLFRPSRFVDVHAGAAVARQSFAIAELPAAFDGVFLLGLLPAFVDPGSNLFVEAVRVLGPGGLVVASTPLHGRSEAPIPSWALKKTNRPFDLAFELTRGELDLVTAHIGVTAAGRFLIVARKR